MKGSCQSLAVTEWWTERRWNVKQALPTNEGAQDQQDLSSSVQCKQGKPP